MIVCAKHVARCAAMGQAEAARQVEALKEGLAKELRKQRVRLRTAG